MQYTGQTLENSVSCVQQLLVLLLILVLYLHQQLLPVADMRYAGDSAPGVSWDACCRWVRGSLLQLCHACCRDVCGFTASAQLQLCYATSKLCVAHARACITYTHSHCLAALFMLYAMFQASNQPHLIGCIAPSDSRELTCPPAAGAAAAGIAVGSQPFKLLDKDSKPLAAQRGVAYRVSGGCWGGCAAG
jgi:hypothetical protein